MTERSITVRLLFSTLCAALLSFGLTACVLTGFAIPGNVPTLLLTALAAAVFCSALFYLWYPVIWISLAAILGGFVLWQNLHELRDSLFLVFRQIAQPYLRNFAIFEGYRVTVSVPDSTTGMPILIVAAILIAALTAWTVNRRITYVPLGILTAAGLVLCLMNYSTAPAPWAILPVLGAMLLLVLVRSERLRGGAWILGLVPFTAAFLLILYAWVQPASYVRPEWADTLQARLSQLSIVHTDAESGSVQWVTPFADPTLGGSVWNTNRDRVDLDRIGPQSLTGTHVMDVLSQRNGQIYLRGYSLAEYDGHSWQTAENEPTWEEDGFLSVGDGRGSEELVISTDRPSTTLYLPYAVDDLPAGGAYIGDSYAENGLRSRVYTVSYTPSLYLPTTDPDYEAYVYETYLQVPEETRAALSGWVNAYHSEVQRVADEYGDALRLDPVTVVLSAVRGKPYDLNTPAPPKDQDFVSWYWTEGETGYCVHYASLAVMMLRSLEIPARYVSGYLADVKAGEWCAVTEDDAHAWVEYYVPGYGWRFLETTGAESFTYTPRPSENDTLPQPNEQQDNPEAPQPEPQAPVEEEQPAPEDLPEAPPEPQETLPQFGLSMPLYYEEQEPTGQYMIPFGLWFPAILILAALAVIIPPVLWMAVIRALRRRWRSHGDLRTQTRRAYRSLCVLARMSGERIPEWAETAALSAAFSNAPAKEETHQSLQALNHSLRQKIRREAHDLRKFYVRVILAIER